MSTKLNNFLYKNAVFLYILFFAAALIAFWPNYFSRIFGNVQTHIHVHGIVMSLWCIMLIAQATLIRFNSYKWHRRIGKFSYLLAPLIIISGFHTAHTTLSGVPVAGPYYYSQIALMFNSLVFFGILYTLAMVNRKKPLIHARYMICTFLPMITPVTDRLTYFHFPSYVGLVPTIQGAPTVWLFGFGIANAILLLLATWDLLSKKRSYVFLIVLGII